jgi:hypothetical protein
MPSLQTSRVDLIVEAVMLLSDLLLEWLPYPSWAAVLKNWYNAKRKTWTGSSLEVEVEVPIPVLDCMKLYRWKT